MERYLQNRGRLIVNYRKIRQDISDGNIKSYLDKHIDSLVAENEPITLWIPILQHLHDIGKLPF